MQKRRGWPDRRGMGSQSDAISEQFVPSERYKQQQLDMAKILIEAGYTAKQAAALFQVSTDQPASQKPMTDDSSLLPKPGD